MNGFLRALALMAAAALFTGHARSAPAEGQSAPGFRLQDQNGQWHALEDYRGQWVALYFYPKDDTPGCTTEACKFRDDVFRFREKDCAILGVSVDDVESHAAFAEKHSLPFPLLADTEHEVSTAYDVLRDWKLIKIANRETFLIAPDGTIAVHYENVDPDEHSAEVLADLDRLQAPQE